jgi:pre-rRNA-processing protein TSR1
MAAPDALRVIVKRIVLAGYPFRVHKRKAVIRYMFFNPSDVRWFKPVELCTKQGLRGHIKEPLGTHGYMKCTFSEPIDQSDTVRYHALLIIH